MSGVRVDRPQAQVLRITLDRAPVNALDRDAFDALGEAFKIADDDPLGWVVLTAAGERTFSAGTELDAFATTKSTDAVTAASTAAFAALAACPVPVLGALNAPAVGVGAMLAAQCDLLVAHRGVRFVLPEVGAGFPGGGSHVARLAPWFKLQRMVLLGEPLTAEEADAHGVFAALLDAPEEVMPAALLIAERLAALSPSAVRPARRILREPGDAAAMTGYRAELVALASALDAKRMISN